MLRIPRKFSRTQSAPLARSRRHRLLLEALEPRQLLSAADVATARPALSDLVAALPSGTPLQMTSAGLEIQQVPQDGNYNANYVILDANAHLTSNNDLAPFSTNAPTGMTPARMRHAYGIDQIMFGAVQGDGTGQTIAIVDAYDYPTAASDLHNFDLAFGLPDPPSLTRVNQDGGTTLPGTDPAGPGNSWEVEEALDVEWAHAIAPGANILLVEANSPTDADLIQHAVNYARSAPGVVAVTMSFGRLEDSTVTSLDQYFTTPAGHPGVTFLASTGDSGSPGGYPAKSPNVVAVGGTTLSVDASGNYISETGWSGSGGGLSTYESQPAYQKGIVTQSATQRAIPDVAFDADPASGASVYDSYDFGTTFPWITVGGTSLSSPCWAGIIAIADQGRALGGVDSMDGIGKTLPRLYQIAAANFHDITAGSNGLAAGVGYDLVTGRGSPIANTLIPQLSAAGPFVVGTTPSGTVTTPPTAISFNFSGAMDPTSFSIAADVDSFTGPGATDLRSSITGFTWLNANSTLQINFSAPAPDGAYTLVIGPQILSAGGTPMDQNQNGVAGEPADTCTATIAYDASPLQVTSTSPANGSLVQIPFTSIDVHFNEPFDPASVGLSDLTLSQGTVTAATVIDPTTVRYTLSNISTEGALTLSMAAGAVNKAGDGFPMLPFTETLATDIGTRSMPAAVGIAPLGALIYQASSNGTIGNAADTDSFTIALDAGQTLTVALSPAAGLQPTLLVLDPSSKTIGQATSAAAGQGALLQTLTVSAAGTYTITVGSAGGTAGAYSLILTLNAQQQAGPYGGPTNQSLPTAQDIDGSFLSLGGNASRGAVLGGTVTAAGSNGTLLSNDFESGLNGWVIANTFGTLWHVSTGRGTQPGHSATRSLYFGQGEGPTGGGTYNTGSRVAGTVTSPSFTIPAGTSPSLTFNYVLQAEAGASFDQALVQISSNGGATFTTLVNLTATAQSSAWKAATPLSLAAYAGQTVQIRFSFDTLDSIANAFEGWYLDDVAVQSTNVPSVQDYYSFSMNAGDAATLVLKNLAAATDDVKLLNAAGNLLASGATGYTNADRAIVNFSAPSSGTYYILVSSTAGAAPYSLAVTRNAAFDLEPNDTLPTAQTLSPGESALGYVSSSGAGADLDNFDTGILSGYTFTGANTASVTTAAAHDGPYGLSLGTPASDWMYRNDAAAHNQPGETISVWVRDTGNLTGRAYFGFGATAAGAFSLVIAPNTSQFIIQQNSGYSFLNIATAPQTWQANKWYRMEVVWQANGTLVGNLYDSDGSTLLNTITAAGTTASAGGIAFRSFTDGFNFDSARIGSGASDVDTWSVALTAGTPVSFLTRTPADGPGEFSNSLDPLLQLYDPSGTLVASDDNSAPDGHNAVLNYIPTSTGLYRIKVLGTTSSTTSGAYILSTGQTLSLALPADAHEGDGVLTGMITASTAPTSDLSITLTSSNPGRLTLPTTVILPAGQTSLSFPITVIDDALLNGLETVNIIAAATSYFSAAGSLKLHDNESAALQVSLPANAREGDGTVTGTITASAAPTSDIVIQLASDNTSKLTVPTTVILPAGATSVNFTATVVNNTLIDGTQNTTVSASVENWTPANATIAVADNDNFITLTLPPSGWEGQLLSNATVSIGGTLTTSLVVNLLSGNTSELSLPATVTIPAGQTSATFSLSLLQDGLKAGTRNVAVSANATGLAPANGTISIHDSTLDHIAFDPLSGTRAAGTPFSVTLRAFNVANETIVTFAGAATLSANGTLGSEPVAPTAVTFSSGIWSGNANLTVADPAVSLTATATGAATTSNTFTVQAGAVAAFTWGNITSPQIATLPFPATLTARDAYNNTVTNFNGSVSLSGLVGAPVSQTILGNPAYNSTNTSGTLWTEGYRFTPSSDFTITAVRSFYGSKVSIWSDAGTLLASQPVSGPNGSWTETSLASPITLLAGQTYRIATYSAGQITYWSTTLSSTTPVGTIVQSVESSGDAFPINSDSAHWWFVDLRGTIGGFAAVPVSPASVLFSNGTWTGNITVGQGAAGMHLHATDTSGHIGDSNTFDVIQRTLTFSLPSDVRETDGSSLGQISVYPAPASDLTLTLNSSDPSRLGLPATVTIPAGQTSALVPISLIDNALLDGLEAVTITASTPGYPTATGSINVHDNESAVLSVSVPLSAVEGSAPVAGTVTASAPATRDIVVQLSSANTNRATVPATVTIPAGQTSASFPINIVNNTVIDGTSFVTFGAAYDNWIGGFGTMAVLDNDNALSLSLPVSGWEGQTLSNATVSIGGTSSANITITLASNNPAELSLPGSVTIPAGQTSVTFPLSLLQDGLKAGTQNVTISATAPGLGAANNSIAVHDSTLDRIAFDPITGPKTAAVPFAVTARAFNIANELIQVFSANGTLAATGASGGLPVTPSVAPFSGGTFTGNISINAVDPAAVLQLNAAGVNAFSNAFATQAGPVAGFQWSPISGNKTAGVPFPETITAVDANGFTTTSFNGSAALSGAIGSATSATLFGTTPTPTSSFNNGTYTIGYSFTPSSNITVTAVRSYAGSKVEIWTNTGALLLSQPVTGPNGSWTETPIGTPLNLTGGVTYRIATYTAGQVYYGRMDMTSTSPLGTLNTPYEIPGDAFPSGASSWRWIFVDLRATVGTFTSIPILPASATFTNGVWTGNITVNQAATSMHLHLQDSASHTADSAPFNVLLPDPAHLTATTIGDGSPQRSMVKSISLTFDQPVSFGPGALTLTRSDGLNVPLSLSTTDNKTFTISFSGSSIVGGSLADGRYSLSINASAITDQYARPIAGGNQIINFFRLFGDLDGDGDTDALDYLAFRNAYGKSAGQLGYLSAFDYDGKGVVDANDNTAFRLRLGRRI